MRQRLDRLGRRWPWFGTALRVQDRYGDLNGNYLASAVTLAAFISIFPLLLVAIAVVGFVSSGSSHLAGDLVRDFGLTGSAAQTFTDALHAAERSRKAASVVGLVTLLWSGLGLVAAIQYALNSVWQVKGRGIRDKAVGLGWLAGAGLLVALSFGVTAAIAFLPAVLAPLGIVLGLAVDVGLWLWTLKALPNRDVGWKPLLPGACMGAVGFEILKAVGSLYVPRAVQSSSGLYGSLGIVFAVLAWLFLFGRLLVYATTLNVVRWEEDHGSTEVEVQVPRVSGTAPVAATRSGDIVTGDERPTAGVS